MTTALDLIKGALRRINSYQSGETIAAPDEQDCLDTFNDLLDSLSLDKQLIFGSNEWILGWTAQKNRYLIGNPTNAELNGCTGISQVSTSGSIYTVYPNTSSGGLWPNITGTLTSGSPTITGVTNMPINLVAGSTQAFSIGSGSILTSGQNLIPANTTVIAFNAGAQTITMSANAISNSTGNDSLGYTVPGDFPIPRPLRISRAFTRFNQLDFTLDVAATEKQYTELLYKAQPGPWPILGWYNNTFPYGILNVYQSPGNNAELHLFCDTILNKMTLNQQLSMPQGYRRMFKWLLAKEYCAEYGFPLTEAIKTNAQQAMDLIKALNAEPASVASYDGALLNRGGYDAGWITHGGYR